MVCMQHERARALPLAARADELLQLRVVDDTLPVLGKRHLRGVMQAAAVFVCMHVCTCVCMCVCVYALGKRHLRGVMQAAAVQCGAEREGVLAPDPRLQGLLGCPAALYIDIYI